MDKLNFFNNKQNLKHENTLTNAFLTILKLIPEARIMLLDIIKREYYREYTGNRIYKENNENEEENFWSTLWYKNPVIQTQKGNVEFQCQKIISTLLTDELLREPILVQNSERTAIYDGIIIYEPESIFIM